MIFSQPTELKNKAVGVYALTAYYSEHIIYE